MKALDMQVNGYDTYIDVKVDNLEFREDDIITFSGFDIADGKDFVVDSIVAISKGKATLLLVEKK